MAETGMCLLQKHCSVAEFPKIGRKPEAPAPPQPAAPPNGSVVKSGSKTGADVQSHIIGRNIYLPCISHMPFLRFFYHSPARRFS